MNYDSQIIISKPQPVDKTVERQRPEALWRKQEDRVPAHSIFNLTGKRGYVTGGGSGLGRAIAIALAEAGASVAVSDIDLAKAEEVAGAIAASGGRALPVRTDVSSKADADALVSATAEAFGGLDFAFNNAGTLKITKPEDVTEAEWQAGLAVNLTGCFLCCQAAGRHMIAHGGGKIVNTASIAGIVVNSGVAYSTAKAGIIQLTRVLAVRWAKYHIHVNSISPGFMRTQMIAGRLQRDETVAEMIRQTPLRRVGEPRDIVGPALFLASPASDFVTGHNLIVDGGVTLT
jgi:NAD(P)-dependent dehydrogenase (short-subunit alcohol dehydrogenase family)